MRSVGLGLSPLVHDRFRVSATSGSSRSPPRAMPMFLHDEDRHIHGRSIAALAAIGLASVKKRFAFSQPATDSARPRPQCSACWTMKWYSA